MPRHARPARAQVVGNPDFVPQCHGLATGFAATFPGMSSENLHEPIELLSEDTQNQHRAIVSLREELEAVDWYQQRAEACTDAELRSVLTHNKNEEIEHAMMTLEWLRRKDPTFAANIGTYVGSTGPIIDVEKGVTAGGSEAATTASVSLGIGSLKGLK